jgi:two-component system OmpR family sensor kinase
MSLRARVLIGTAVIAVVLGVAAVVITRIAESHLVGRVDRQLATATAPFEHGRRDACTVQQAVIAGPEAFTGTPQPEPGISATGSTAPDAPEEGAVPPAEDGAGAPGVAGERGEPGQPGLSDVRATVACRPAGEPEASVEGQDGGDAGNAAVHDAEAGTGGPAASGGSAPPPAAGTGADPPVIDPASLTILLRRLSAYDVGLVIGDDTTVQHLFGADGDAAEPPAGGAGAPTAGRGDPDGAPGGDPVPPRIDAARARAAARNGQPFTVVAEETGTRYRARAVANEVTGSVFVVSQPLDEVDATVDRLVAVEAIVTAAILLVLGLVAWWVVRHGVRPLRRMAGAASVIAAGDLSHRVPDMAPGTEAHQLGVALNRMLGRIEEAFDERARSEERLRQFVADASHELRTPVTTIRGYTELYESGALDDRTELSEAMRRTRQEAVRMGNLVDDMLLLARLDQGRPLERAPVDVAALVHDAGRDARAVDPRRPVTVTVTVEPDGPLVVEGDADRLRQVVANLIGNALVHTPPGATLDLRAHRERDGGDEGEGEPEAGDGGRDDGGWVVVEVGDRGPGMVPEVARRAFERFYRADPSRSRHRGGSGLGLAIVEATVTAHGGDVTLDSAPGRGTIARVRLPATSQPAPGGI